MTCTGQGVSVRAPAAPAAPAAHSSSRGTVSASRFVAKKHTVSVVADVMEQLFRGLQAELLQEIVAWSLDQLQLEFFAEPILSSKTRKSRTSSTHSTPSGPNPGTSEVAELHAMMRGPLATQLTVFLFLFNVHAELKDRVLGMDPDNRAKLVRFMADMRKHVVMSFCVDERQHPRDFVQAAHECYMLA